MQLNTNTINKIKRQDTSATENAIDDFYRIPFVYTSIKIISRAKDYQNHGLITRRQMHCDNH